MPPASQLVHAPSMGGATAAGAAAAAAAAAGAAGGDASAKLHQLTNLNDINRLLHETVARERAIEAELDRQLGRRGELERSILLLNAATSEVRCTAREAGGSVCVLVDALSLF